MNYLDIINCLELTMRSFNYSILSVVNVTLRLLSRAEGVKLSVGCCRCDPNVNEHLVVYLFFFSLAAGYYVISIFDVFLSSVNKQF